MNLIGHNTKTTKVCAGNYRVESSIGCFSVHKFEGKWFVRLDGHLVAKTESKASAMVEITETIRDSLKGHTIRYIKD